MEDNRIPKRILFGSMVEGSRGRGRPKKSWIDCLKEDCERVNITYGKWTEKSKDRNEWRSSISYLNSEKKK